MAANFIFKKVQKGSSNKTVWPQKDDSANLSPPKPFFFILLTHQGSQREVYQEFQPSYAKSCSDLRFRAPPAGYTAQLPQSQQSVNRTANQI